MTEIDNRFSTRRIATNQRPCRCKAVEALWSIHSQEIAVVIREVDLCPDGEHQLDITDLLKPGDVIEGHFKFIIEKIGKGAFGTVR